MSTCIHLLSSDKVDPCYLSQPKFARSILKAGSLGLMKTLFSEGSLPEDCSREGNSARFIAYLMVCSLTVKVAVQCSAGHMNSPYYYLLLLN